MEKIEESTRQGPADESIAGDIQIGEFALSPRKFIERYSAKLEMSAFEIDDITVDYLVAQMEGGVTRFEILQALKRLKGETSLLAFQEDRLGAARSGIAGESLVYEKIVGFAPNDNEAFINYAFRQILLRTPSYAEKVRLCHEVDTQIATRSDILYKLDNLAHMEGRAIVWDSINKPALKVGDDRRADLLVKSGNRALDETGKSIVSLCERTETGWRIGDNVDVKIINAHDGGWRFQSGFFLDGSRSHIEPGTWRADINLAQPVDSEVALQIIANGGLSELMKINFRGNISASFVFEKCVSHTFIQVRLKSVGNKPISWASLNHLRLVKISS